MDTSKLPSASFPTKYGTFCIYAFKEGRMEHLALVKGDVCDKDDVPVRIHSQCITGDALGSLRCDCGVQLDHSLEYIGAQDYGILFYLGHEGRGIGLFNKIKAYELQDKGDDTVEANERLGFESDMRDYGIVADFLISFGVRSVHLITNNPSKLDDLTRKGVAVTQRIPLIVPPNKFNAFYLQTKREKMHHIFG
ncbi:GTP cyclohydrolase II [archaeon]|nr:MAG: GTP cyclohydrolase II [archaeon]